MHDEPITISTARAKRLVDTQLPGWAGQPVRPLAATGTDNILFRLGADHLLRFPRRPSAAPLLARELTFLPRFPGLPLEIPQPVARGAPGEGYPWEWAVYRWIEGDPAAPRTMPDPEKVARDLAAFLRAFHALPGLEGPIAGHANHHRGVPLDRLDDRVGSAIAALSDLFDPRALAAIWEDARAARPWGRAPAWLHGDLRGDNLLMRDGRLVAVIDFGLAARGDPAADLLPAWMLFDPPARDTFLDALGAKPDMIRRGRGWALHAGAVALAHYRHGLHPLGRLAHRALAELLDDFTA